MSTLQELEAQLVSSKKVREFLKNFSETQWSRVVKASVIMGIQELERSQKIQQLSANDLEDLVGKLNFSRGFFRLSRLAPEIANLPFMYSQK